MNESIKESIKWMLVVNADPSKNLSRIDGEPTINKRLRNWPNLTAKNFLICVSCWAMKI